MRKLMANNRDQAKSGETYLNANGELRRKCACGATMLPQYSKCLDCANKSFTEAVRTKRNVPQKPATFIEEDKTSSVEDEAHLYNHFI